MSRRVQVPLAVVLTLVGALLVTQGSVAAAAPASPSPVVAGAYTPLAAQRILDTRSGDGAPAGLVRAGTSVSVVVTGRGGVPATGVGAVALTVTVAAPTASGYAVVYPAGTARPNSSNVNFAAGRNASNLVVVPVAADGRVTVFSSATTHLVADVSGWYAAGTPSQAGMYGAVTPNRVLDTRTGTGAPRSVVRAGGALTLALAGRGGLPAGGLGAVLLDVTVTSPAAAGYITAYAAGTTRPTASVVDFARSQTVANLVLAPVSSDGRVVLYTSAATHLVADVTGYQLGGSGIPVGGFHPTTPTRVLDNRGTGGQSSDRAVQVATAARAGIPSTDVTAVALVVTAVQDGGRPGNVVVWRGGGARPSTTNVSYASRQTIANSVLAPVGPGGRVSLQSSTGLFLVVDVVGWVGRGAGPTATARPVSPVDGLGGGSGTVACASADFCVTGDGHGQVFTWDGAAWSGPVQLTATGGAYENGVFAATCPTASECVLLDDGYHLWRGDGTTWTQFATLPPTNPHTLSCTTAQVCFTGRNNDVVWASDTGGWRGTHVFPDGDDVTGVSCSGPTVCVAVSRAGRVSRFDGTSWSTCAVAADSVHLQSLSCATPDSCVAAGSDTATGKGAVVRLDDGSWQRDDTVAVTGPLAAVSCVATGCAAVDTSGQLVADRSSRWRRIGTAPGNGGWSIGCAAATSCQVVSVDGTAARFDGTGLVDVQAIDPETSLFRGLSCVSRTSCTALGSLGDVRHFDGTTWTTTAHLDGFGDFSALSCASDTWCAAVDRDGHAVTFDASGWSAVETIAAGHPLRTLSCPVERFCMAGSEDGQTYVYRSGGWQLDHTFPISWRASVACTSATWCLAAVREQNWRWDGATWARIPNTPGPLLGVACSSTTACVGGGASGAVGEGQGFEYDGVGWDDGQPLTGDARYTENASCVRGGPCVLMSSSTVFVTTGATWSPTVVSAPQLTAVSCAVDGFCMVVNERNSAFALDYS